MTSALVPNTTSGSTARYYLESVDRNDLSQSFLAMVLGKNLVEELLSIRTYELLKFHNLKRWWSWRFDMSGFKFNDELMNRLNRHCSAIDRTSTIPENWFVEKSINLAHRHEDLLRRCVPTGSKREMKMASFCNLSMHWVHVYTEFPKLGILTAHSEMLS